MAETVVPVRSQTLRGEATAAAVAARVAAARAHLSAQSTPPVEVSGELFPWRSQPVIVQGRSFTLGEVKGGRLFHGSTVPLSPGDVLEPGHGRNFTQSAKNAVSLTSDANTAFYWARKGNPDDIAIIYEVEPLGEVEPWRVALADYGTSFDLEEGRVGRARVVGVFEREDPPWLKELHEAKARAASRP